MEQEELDFDLTVSRAGVSTSELSCRKRSARFAAVTAVATGMVLMSGAVPASQAAAAGHAHSASQSAASFITGYFQAMDRALMPGHPPAMAARPAALYLSSYYPAAPRTPQSQQMLAYEVGKVDGFHMWVRERGDIYKSISTSVKIESLAVSASGQRTVAIVEAVTTMRWSPGPGPKVTHFTRAKAASMAAAAKQGRVFGPGSTITSMVAASHRMLLIRQGGAWKLQYDYYVDPFDQGLAPDHTSPRAEGQALPVPAAGHAKPASMIPAYITEDYWPGGAAQYADHYWHSYNSAYENFNSSGGDCTNFVSQSLNDTWSGHNSGSLDNDFWNWYYYYESTVEPSNDWVNANDLHTYVGKNPYGSAYDIGWHGASGSESAVKSYDINDMLVGDLHFYHWSGDSAGANHAAIAVAYLSDGETLVDAHNTDSYHVLWNLGASGATYYLDRMHDTINFHGLS